MRKFKLNKDQFVELVEYIGGAIATDRITVDGCKVGYMYRREPINNIDSGWRFFEGTESREYLDNTANSEVYDVNTIANYDRDIIPYLDLPVGVELEREGDSARFNIISG